MTARQNIGAAATSGAYPELLAGNLVGQTVEKDTYRIRPTGNGGEDVASGTASVIGMEGNSAVWNQLVQNGDFSSSDGWSVFQGTMDIVNNVLTYTPTNPGGGSRIINSRVLYGGHKYYFRWTIKPNGYSSSTRVVLKPIDTSQSNTGGNNVSIENGVKTLALNVITPQYDSNILIYCNNSGGMNVGNSVELYSFNSIDLTLLGIDNLTTVAQVEEWLAQHVGTKPYYPYNEGEILSAQTLGFKTYGQNLLNPETKKATLIPYSWGVNSNIYTIKNVPSGATATFTPDNTSTAETVDVSSGSLDITSYGSGVLELSDTTADTYVCMKWDERKDDDVVLYEEHTYNFDVTKVYGKVNGEGEYVQCFPDGMMSAGSVHDTLTASEGVIKTRRVDLSTRKIETRYTGSTNKTISLNLPYYYNKTSLAILSQTYKYIGKVIGASELSNPDNKEVGLYTYSGGTNVSGVIIYIVMPVGSSLTNNDVIVYSRYSNLTYTNLIYSENGGQTGTPLGDVLMNITVNNWSMEEQLITPYDEQTNQPTAIPATVSTRYGLNAVEAIAKLQKTAYTENEMHSNLASLLSCINTNCSTVLGGTFSVSDTATDKVFSFTFTPNE